LSTSQRRELQDLKECSFKPQINAKLPRSISSHLKQSGASSVPAGASTRQEGGTRHQGTALTQTQSVTGMAGVFENRDLSANSNTRTDLHSHSPVQRPVPKGFEKQVSRMRQANREREEREEKSQKRARGEQYDRVKLAKMKPPSFHETKKRQLLLYVDVNVTPTKTGRIGIHVGDDIREVAHNFCKAF